METVYLKVNEKGETVNVFGSLGMAICGIEMSVSRTCDDLIEEHTLTKLVWHERMNTEIKHSYTIMECPVCTDITLDYMDAPRAVARKL